MLIILYAAVVPKIVRNYISINSHRFKSNANKF